MKIKELWELRGVLPVKPKYEAKTYGKGSIYLEGWHTKAEMEQLVEMFDDYTKGLTKSVEEVKHED